MGPIRIRTLCESGSVGSRHFPRGARGFSGLDSSPKTECHLAVLFRIAGGQSPPVLSFESSVSALSGCPEAGQRRVDSVYPFETRCLGHLKTLGSQRVVGVLRSRHCFTFSATSLLQQPNSGTCRLRQSLKPRPRRHLARARQYKTSRPYSRRFSCHLVSLRLQSAPRHDAQAAL